MGKYLIGIDVGTTGAKAMVVDLDGNVISSGYREYGCVYPNPDWVEQDAEMVTQQTFGACRDAVEKSGLDKKEIIAAGFSVQRATFLLADKNKKVIGGNFYGWQDNRAASELEYIKSKIPAEKLYRIAGQPVAPTFSFEKIIWIMRNQPEKYAAADKILLVSDYIMWRFGADDFYCEKTNACCSSMIDVNTLQWSDTILDTFSISKSKLPKLVDPGTVIGKVTAETSAFTGLAEGTLLVTATGDQQCAAIGAGVTEPGKASLTLGTAGLLVTATAGPRLEDKSGFMMVPSSGILGLFQLEGLQLGAASSYRWLRDTVCEPEKADAAAVHEDPYVIMEKHVKGSKPGSNGVFFMPYLTGAGYPYWDSTAKGSFMGLKFSTSKSDLVRSVMEGITLESKDMYEKMKEAGAKINSLAITGGATKSPAWRQMIADMFNVEVKELKVGDATIIGAAVLAGVGAGLFKNGKEGAAKMVSYTNTIKPDAAANKKYEKLYQIYTAAYAAMSKNSIYRLLSEFVQNSEEK